MFAKSATPTSPLGALGPAGLGIPVVDSNTLRQAALQRSWQRDQRVARRRLALRWLLWWLWKCRYVLLIVCAVVAYLVYRFETTDKPMASSDLAQRPAPAVSPSVTTSVPPAPPPAAPGDIRLRMQPQLLEPTPSVSRSAPAPSEVPTPFQLKPATQLTIPETKP
jgi:hypothetical protein